MNRCFQIGLRVFSVSAIVAANFGIAGCATPRRSRLLMTGVAGATGYIVGENAAPKGEKKELHAAYWGAVTGLVAAITSDWIFNDREYMNALEQENRQLAAKVELIQNTQKSLVKSGQGRFDPKSSSKLAGKVPISWRLYMIDRWETQGANRLIHLDQMVELDEPETSSKTDQAK